MGEPLRGILRKMMSSKINDSVAVPRIGISSEPTDALADPHSVRQCLTEETKNYLGLVKADSGTQRDILQNQAERIGTDIAELTREWEEKLKKEQERVKLLEKEKELVATMSAKADAKSVEAEAQSDAAKAKMAEAETRRLELMDEIKTLQSQQKVLAVGRRVLVKYQVNSGFWPLSNAGSKMGWGTIVGHALADFMHEGENIMYSVHLSDKKTVTVSREDLWLAEEIEEIDFEVGSSDSRQKIVLGPKGVLFCTSPQVCHRSYDTKLKPMKFQVDVRIGTQEIVLQRIDGPKSWRSEIIIRVWVKYDGAVEE